MSRVLDERCQLDVTVLVSPLHAHHCMKCGVEAVDSAGYMLMGTITDDDTTIPKLRTAFCSSCYQDVLALIRDSLPEVWDVGDVA